MWGRAGLARSDRARGNSKFVLFDIKKMWVSISEPAPAESHATQTSRLCGVCGPAGGRRRGGARGISLPQHFAASLALCAGGYGVHTIKNTRVSY